MRVQFQSAPHDEADRVLYYNATPKWEKAALGVQLTGLGGVKMVRNIQRCITKTVWSVSSGLGGMKMVKKRQSTISKVLIMVRVMVGLLIGMKMVG